MTRPRVRQSKKKDSGRLESFQNSPLKCISLEDGTLVQVESEIVENKTRFATPEFTSTPLMKMNPKQPFPKFSEETRSPVLDFSEFLNASPMLMKEETKSPILEGMNKDLPASNLLDSSIISLDGDSSNDSETVGSENTVESIDFSDIMKITKSPEPKKISKTPPPKFVKKRRTQREPNFQRTLREPCFLASPIHQKKNVNSKDMTQVQMNPCSSGDTMAVDKALVSPTKVPVATPPQHLDIAKRASNSGNRRAPTPTRTPERGNRLAPHHKEVECLSPNTLFHKPMETLVGEIQKLMCDVGAPPPNINRSRKRGRVNPKAAANIEQKVAQEKKLKRMVQPSSETKKQRRESEVATPPQYEQRNRGDLPPMKNYSRKHRPSRKKKTKNAIRSVSPENSVPAAEKKTTKMFPKKQKSRQNTPEKQMEKITPESRITRKYSTEKKRIWEKTPEVMQIEKARKASAQKKRAREMTPELMQLDREDTKVTSLADNARKRKRTPTIRKYNFRFKRKKLNNPLPSKIEILPRMHTPLQFTSKIHVDSRRWSEVVGGILGDVLGKAKPTLVEIPNQSRFRSFCDGMFGDTLKSQELIPKEPNLYILDEQSDKVSTDAQRFTHSIRMIRNDNDHRLIHYKMNDKTFYQRLQQAFSDLAKFCNQDGAAPVIHRTFSNFDSADTSTIDIGKVPDGVHVIFGENNLPGINSKTRHFSMVGCVTPLHEESLQLGSMHYVRGPCPLYFCVIKRSEENDAKMKKLRERHDLSFNLNHTPNGFIHPKLLEDEGITFEHALVPPGHILILPCGSIYQTLTIGFTVWESIAICGEHWFKMFSENASSLSLYTSQLENFAYPPNLNIFTQEGRHKIVEYWKQKLDTWKPDSQKLSLDESCFSLPESKLKQHWIDFQTTIPFRHRISVFPFPTKFITRYHIFRFESNRPLRVCNNITLKSGFCTLWDNQEEWKSLSVTTNFDDSMIAFCVWVVRHKAMNKLAENQIDLKKRLNGFLPDKVREEGSPEGPIKDEDVYPWAVQLYPNEIINLESFRG